MSEERNIRIEDSGGNIYYPHAKAKTTFTENGETIDKYIPNSSLHPVIDVDIDDYISFIMSGRLSDLKVTIPRSGWFVMNVTRGGTPFACEWRNLPTYDLLYMYNNVTVNNKLLPEATVFSFEKGSGMGRKMEYNNKGTITGSFTSTTTETKNIKVGFPIKSIILLVTVESVSTIYFKTGDMPQRADFRIQNGEVIYQITSVLRFPTSSDKTSIDIYTVPNMTAHYIISY